MLDRTGRKRNHGHEKGSYEDRSKEDRQEEVSAPAPHTKRATHPAPPVSQPPSVYGAGAITGAFLGVARYPDTLFFSIEFTTTS